MLSDLLNQPFPGFEKKALKFLKALSVSDNNNKKWFDEHRNEYEMYLKLPMRNLIDTLSSEIRKIDPDIVVNYKSIFRINRDVRFSKDKKPYKTHYAAAFAFEKVKSSEIPQFYFHFSPDEFIFAAGQYSMDALYLKKIRRGIYSDFENLKSIINTKSFLNNFGSVRGESLSKLPKGFENPGQGASDPLLIKLLMMKQFYVFKEYNPDVILSEELPDLIVENIKLSYDFTKYLDKVSK